MITTYQNYPSGFRTPVVGEYRTDTQADPQVASYMATLTTAIGSRVNSWEFRRNVLIHANELFGDFRGFLMAQRDNTALSPHQRAFLSDTIQYINSGKRPLALRTRVELIHAEKGEGYNTYPSDRVDLSAKLAVPVEDYMYHWINHGEGFIDLLCTLDLIFGEPLESGFHRVYL